MKQGNSLFSRIMGDFLGGTSGMLVALPSTIAYGIMSFAPLGPTYAIMAALGAVMGNVAFNMVTPFLGGTRCLISAPSAPAAAVVSVFVLELINKGSIPPEIIPVYVTLLTVFSGTIQFLIGNFGGGKFVKYIPFPVIAGYLTGVSILIMIGQVPKFLGLDKNIKWYEGLLMPTHWQWHSVCIGAVTIAAMLLSKKWIKHVPAIVVALAAGIITYFLLAIFDPAMLTLDHNTRVIGHIAQSPMDIVTNISARWSLFPQIDWKLFPTVIVPGVTLALLLSITTLNTCVVVDALTFTSHNPRRELMSQGVGTIAAALVAGIPGAGLMSATSENLHNGGKTQYSTLFAGVNTLLVVVLAGGMLAWLPHAALAGILIMVAFRMIDLKILDMLKNKSTLFDFIVIVTVVIAAVNLDLIKGAGVGIAMAILLFLREQMGISVIRRKLAGNQMSSKKIRLKHQREVLEVHGGVTLILELQGQLFFGTTDQLYSNLESYYDSARFIILDMRRIQSVDFTAANMLKKILARIKQRKGYLIFSSIPEKLPTGQNVRQYFVNLGLGPSEHLRIFESTEDALEWVEDDILSREDTRAFSNDRILDLHEIELVQGIPEDALAKLRSGLEERIFEPNQLIFHAGDVSDEIYFVRKGIIKIVLPLGDGKTYHLLTIGMGGIFGEMAFIDNVRRSADAMPLERSHLFVLSREKFEEVTKQYPELAGKFYQRLAFLTVQRLRQANKELKIFQEN